MKRSQPDRSEIVEAAFAALRETSIPDGPSPEVFSAILEAGSISETDLLPITRHRRRITMKRTAKIAVVAAVLVGVWISFSYVNTDRSPSAAFAEVCEQIRQARTVSWTQVQKPSEPDQNGMSSTMWCAYDYAGRRMRMTGTMGQGEVAMEAVFIFDGANGKQLLLMPQPKVARLTEGLPSQAFPAKDPFTHFRDKLMPEAEPLGKKRIDGRDAVGFRVSGDGQTTELWVDTRTDRVVLFEMKHDSNRPKFGSDPSDLLFRDIVFDPELDESLFSLELPEGYQFMKTRLCEEDVVEWLQLLAEYNEDTFPAEPWLQEEQGERLFEKLTKQTRSPREQRMLHGTFLFSGHQKPIQGFVEQTGADGSRYVGGGVKLGDASSPVFWYKPKDGNTFRVVYGDLSVKDVPPEDLPRTDGPE